jgi:hypothetical protein
MMTVRGHFLSYCLLVYDIHYEATTAVMYSQQKEFCKRCIDRWTKQSVIIILQRLAAHPDVTRNGEACVTTSLTFHYRQLAIGLVTGLAISLPAVAQDSDATAEIYQRLQQLEQRQAEFEKQLQEKDARIRELESELQKAASPAVSPAPSQAGQITPATTTTGEPTTTVQVDSDSTDRVLGKIGESASISEDEPYGEFTPGKGFTVAKTKHGEIDLSVYSYIRYLNQKGLDDTYIDHFGNERPIDIRNDFQVNKVFLYTKGWLLDPKFNYLFYVWSTNTALGNTSNNLVAGALTYRFAEAFNLTGGVVGLPATRSMMGQFPFWHRVDTRTIADEFMRGSFTQGLSADGKLAEGLNYRFTLGNNLSNFGVNALKLDDEINTYSGALVWMPTTGEFGPRGAIGDYEYHTELATLFGLHLTHSTEDKQSQPEQNAPENTQIRLSDGVTIFTPDVLAPGVTVDKVDYTMLAVNGGMKYRGFSLEAEAFYRKLDNFQTNAPLLIDELIDKGFQAKLSSMVIPKTLQLYANGSKIFGEYGDPWDSGIGMNWWPFRQRGMRFNTEVLYLRNSPVGYSSLPYTVGANGWVFVANAELAF